MSSEVGVSPRSYFPLILSIALSWILTSLSLQTRIEYPPLVIAPAEEPSPATPPSEALASPAPYLNTLIIVGLITVSGIVVLYLARKRRRLFQAFIGLLIWLLSFGITLFNIISMGFAVSLWILRFWLPISLAAASLVTYLMIRGRGLAGSAAASYIAAGAGSAIGMSIPYWTFIVLMIGISAYDLVAVYKGHLSTLTKEDAVTLKGLTVEAGDLVIGLGDLFFYSLAVSAILRYLGAIPAALASGSVIAGYTITLLALRKRRILPGLPIPLLLALGSAVLAKLAIDLL